MSPTNVALVKLFQADQALRAAKNRLDNASHSVRVQERRIVELDERLRLAQSQLREHQARVAELDLDVKARDEKIERLRRQQQNAKNHKEYQAFLTEINTEKIDKGKIEDELLQVMESVEKSQKETRELGALLTSDQKKCEETRQQLAGRLAELQAEVDRLIPAREQAAAAVPPKAMDMFERLCERYDGEAMAAIAKPDRRHEEYVCTACNMSLVADIYNRLRVRDEPVICPNCRRMLFVPVDLPPDVAVNTRPRERRERREKVAPASIGRQTSAADVSRSIGAAEDEAAPEAPDSPEPTENPVVDTAPVPPGEPQPKTS